VRIRIALVAAVPVAFITLSMLSPALPARSAKPTSDRSVSKTAAVPMPPNRLTAFHAAPLASATRKQSAFPLDLSTALLGVHPTQSGTPPAAPAPVATPPTPPAPSGPVDTVTPMQRAEWERVAMCEEGGDWSAGGGRFSGGLGITRSNWVAYGGLEFAPEGAMATEDQQIMVAERIQFDPPDQSGCRGW
jgi:Transglycosylase-like domain